MRFDKFTTKFQQAFADAQSLAVGNDNPYIEPQHLLSALIQQEDGSASSLLSRAGVNLAGLKTALTAAIARLPKVEGQGGEVNVSRELSNLLNVTDKEAQKHGDQFIASEMFLLALTEDKGETGRLLKQNGGSRSALEGRSRQCVAARMYRALKPRAPARHLKNTQSILPSAHARENLIR